MKIDKMIKELNKIKKDYGNIEIKIVNCWDEYSEPRFMPKDYGSSDIIILLLPN